MGSLITVLDKHAKLSTRKRINGMSDEHVAFLRCYVQKFEDHISMNNLDVSRETIMDWLIGLGVAESTRSTIAADMGKMLHWHGLLSKDDYDVVRRAFRMPSDIWSGKSLSLDVVEQLIALSHQGYHELACRRNPAMVMLLATLGPRVTQACSLDVGDVTFDDRNIVFNFVRLKESRQGLQRSYDVKQIPRDLSIGRFNIGRVFQRYVDVRTMFPEQFAPFFISEQKQRIKPRYVQHFVKKMGEKLGLPKLTPHTFRHYVGTTIANKYGIHQAAIVLGHRDINTTMRYINPSTVNIGDTIRGMYEEKAHEKDPG
jgi:integrase